METVPETLKDSCVSVSTLPQSQSSEVNLFLSTFDLEISLLKLK